MTAVGYFFTWCLYRRAISLQSVYTHVIVAQAGLPTHLLAPGPCKLMVTDGERKAVTQGATCTTLSQISVVCSVSQGTALETPTLPHSPHCPGLHVTF